MALMSKADNLARRLLFYGKKSDITRKSGIPERSLYNKQKQPGKLTLDEFAALVNAQELDKEEVFAVVSARF